VASSAALAFLLSTQNQDGGWGYGAGEISILEPTAAALLALGNYDSGGVVKARHRGIEWICTAQHADGGWGINHQDDQGTWQSAWAVWALAQLNALDNGALERGVQWLLNVKALSLDDDDLQKEFREIYAIDSTLRGWSWLPNEMAWTEPTALAMVALESVPATSQIKDRLDEAARYIQDRRCERGGWNVGAPFMLGAAMPPRANPTAWSLLALAGFAPEAIFSDDVAAMRLEMHSDGGVLALGWGLVALHALGEDDAKARAQLLARQEPGGGWMHSPYQTAVAMMALGMSDNV